MQAGCIIPAPKAQAWLNYGFGTPGQAFRSFATAVQGKMLDALYDSLSAGFKDRKSLSRTGFGEAWDLLTSHNRYLRFALYQATKDPEKLQYRRLSDNLCVVQTTYRGYDLEVTLVRSGYWELYTDDPERPEADAWRELDGALPDPFERTAEAGMVLDQDEAGAPRLFTYTPAPGQGVGALSSQRSGYEWKIDDFAFRPEGQRDAP